MPVRRHRTPEAEQLTCLNLVPGSGHGPQEMSSSGTNAHPFDEEAVAPCHGKTGVEKTGNVALFIHHGHMIAAWVRRRFRSRLGIAHLEELETHAGVLLGQNGFERHGVACGIGLPRAFQINGIMHVDHLTEHLG